MFRSGCRSPAPLGAKSQEGASPEVGAGLVLGPSCKTKTHRPKGINVRTVITLLLVAASACAPAFDPLPPMGADRPDAPPVSPPPFDAPTPPREQRGLLRDRDIGLGERVDSVDLADQRRKQIQITSEDRDWAPLSDAGGTHEILFRWKEARSGLPVGARFDLPDLAWPTIAHVSFVSDTMIRIRAQPLMTRDLGRFEWRGESGAILLEIKMRPGRPGGWMNLEFLPVGPTGEVSDRFRSRILGLSLHMPLVLNEWVMQSRTQTVLEQP